MKDELGWRDFMVRSDRAIRRHWALVCCAFAFCWWQEAGEARLREAVMPPSKRADARSRKKNPAVPSEDALLLAAPAAPRAGLAGTAALAHALLAQLLRQAPVARTGRVA